MQTGNNLPCPFCGGAAVLQVANPKYYGLTGAYMRCERCHARGPLAGIAEQFRTADGAFCTPVTDNSIALGKSEALRRWNVRRVAG